MSNPGKAGVKADLLHFISAGQEEVDDPVGHHAVREALDDVVKPSPHVQTVSILLSRLNGDGLSVGGCVTCGLTHCAAHLNINKLTNATDVSQQHNKQKKKTQNILLTRSRVVLSKTSTSFSSLVLAVKMKSSSTHRTYFVVT